MSNASFIISVDVGTTFVKAFIYNESGRHLASASRSMSLLYPKRDRVEIDPEVLWNTFLIVIREAIAASGVDVECVKSIGLSCLRNTFTIWNKTTSKHYTNFIVWKDNRSTSICNVWNNSLTLKSIQTIGTMMYNITRIKKYISMSIFKLTNQMVIPKLIWVLEEYPEIRIHAEGNNVLYGSIDTWLVWKMTEGRVHATDPSNACVSGMYDPFTLSWSMWGLRLFKIPVNILPEVRDTNAGFGMMHKEIIGFEVPIGAVIGDQQAAMFGECCFDVGDVKATLGTGSFIDVNTGDKIHSSFKGIYPVIGWKLKNAATPTYLAEGCSSDTGVIIEWAKKIHLIDSTDDLNSSSLALTTEGLYFVPAFSGLQAPYNDPDAVTAFIGITSETTKDQMTGSIMRSIAYRMKQLYSIMEDEWEHGMKNLVVDGGVANNDFIVQLVADLTGKKVTRDKQREMSGRGAAFLAGLYAGVWKDVHQLKSFLDHERVFHPRSDVEKIEKQEYTNWQKAVQRCLHWY